MYSIIFDFAQDLNLHLIVQKDINISPPPSNVPLYPNPEHALARLIASEVLSEQSLPTSG